MAWTDTTRQNYPRKGLRYPTDLTDAEYRELLGLLPEQERFFDAFHAIGPLKKPLYGWTKTDALPKTLKNTHGIQKLTTSLL